MSRLNTTAIGAKAMLIVSKPFYITVLLFILHSQSVLAASTGGAALDFTLPSNGANNLRLQEQAGNVILINFWASWCAPCREEMPYLNAIHDEYADLGLIVWGINVDEKQKDANKAIKRLKVSFPVLFDSANKVAELYKVDAMPTTLIIDRDGNIRHLHRGYQKGYEIKYEKQVSELLSE